MDKKQVTGKWDDTTGRTDKPWAVLTNDDFKNALTRVSTAILLISAIALFTFEAKAQDSAPSQGERERSVLSFALAATIGEAVYIIDSEGYRGPVSLEVVPSLGWSWFKFDLGLYTTFEDLEIADTNVGYWNFTLRPGGRLTPPLIPLYFRVAFPIQMQTNDFDGGVMFGLGLDFHLVGILGLVFEVDTTLANNLEWGGIGIPLEFRAGLSFHF